MSQLRRSARIAARSLLRSDDEVTTVSFLLSVFSAQCEV